MNTQTHTGTNQHAIVIGGSMAGLLTARVLSDHFARVTILERDAVHDAPEARRGQPQTRHTHGLLANGQAVMEHFFPGIVADLVAGGALVGDMAEAIRWYTFGGYRVNFTSGREGLLASRPYLEWHIRQRVLALPNVTLLDEVAVEGPLASGDLSRITGVEITRRAAGGGREQLSADLVVDAGGRGTQSPKWLERLGYGRPSESMVKVDMGYATRVYQQIPGELPDTHVLMSFGTAPEQKRAGFAFKIEGDRWSVSLAGHHSDHAPSDEAGFLAYARSLPSPDIYNLVSRAEPLSDIIPHKLPSSLRRHYEKMTRFPEGYLVLGDAIASFNPVYGQGMTSAAMQAQGLDELLHQRGGQLHGLAKTFFKRAAKVVDIPWQLAVGEDFRYAETTGPKPPAVDWINAYVARVHRATHRDPVVYDAFLKVMNLLAPPASLFTPQIVLRVLRAGRRVQPQGTTVPPVVSANQPA